MLVKGGYNPDTIAVRAGKPVRLTFRRDESSSCSEMVVFADFGKSAHLPEGEATPVELAPAQPGTYEFTCQLGMLRGRLVVEPERWRGRPEMSTMFLDAGCGSGENASRLAARGRLVVSSVHSEEA